MKSSSPWVVVARLADGTVRYLCPPGSRRSGQDDWSPRVNQARRFGSRGDAEEIVATLETNSAAKEYLAIRL